MKTYEYIRKLRFLVLTVFFVCGLATSGWAAAYYVDSLSGNDGNSGTQTAPWKTVAKVNGFALQPGDTVYFKCGQSYGATPIIPKSGTVGNLITYTSYGTGSKPTIYAFYADNKAYIKADGLEFKNSGSNYYPVCITNGSHHIKIHNSNIIADTASNYWAACYILMNVHHNEIVGCNIANLNVNRQTDAVNIRRNANYNLIMNNYIYKATHYLIDLEGNNSTYPTYTCAYNIIKGNKLWNPEGGMLGLISNAQFNLVEGNDIWGGKSTSYCANLPSNIEFVGGYNIVRNNIIRDNPTSTSRGLESSTFAYNSDPPNQTIYNHVYNNVLTNINGLTNEGAILLASNKTGGSAHNNYYKNNIVYNNLNRQISIWNYAEVYSNYFENNIIYKSSTADVIYYHGTIYNVSGIQSAQPTFFSGNIQKDPLLDSNYKPMAGSPAIDAGAFLTTVTSVSGSGDSFKVKDAGYFCDGFGIQAGDQIMVGSTLVAISRVDYSTNTITVTTPISWSQGANVSLPFSGSKPDIGAFEYGSSSLSTLMPPENLQILK